MQPQDLALTILGAHVREPGALVWSGGMVEILGEFGFSTEAARAALSRLAVRGLLERHRHGRRVSYSLTPRADELLAEGDRRIFSFGRGENGDGMWTVFWHAIHKDRRVERSRLASRLRFLGFGSVQDATWLAAADRERDVVPLVRALGAEPYCTVIVGRLSPELAPAAAVAQAWDLDAVERRYEEFLAEYGPTGRRRRGARSTIAPRSSPERCCSTRSAASLRSTLSCPTPRAAAATWSRRSTRSTRDWPSPPSGTSPR